MFEIIDHWATNAIPNMVSNDEIKKINSDWSTPQMNNRSPKHRKKAKVLTIFFIILTLCF